MREKYYLTENANTVVLGCAYVANPGCSAAIGPPEPGSFTPSEQSISVSLPRNRLEALIHRANTQPDLLAALEALYSGYQYLSEKPPSQPELWEQARTAIAKAKE